MQLVNGLHFRNIRGDLFGGLTAAIVALPLALAFGVSSGAGASAGLYGAVFVGFLAALCGGTPSQVSGPTGPMTVVVTSVFLKLSETYPDSPETAVAMAFAAIVLGGIFQILFGFLRLGQFITLMPYAVISGFMSGIGAIILALEIPPLLGHDTQSNLIASIQYFPTAIADPHPVAAGLGILTLVIVFGWPAKLTRIVPSPLIALVVCTLIAVLAFPDSDFARIGTIPRGLPTLHWPNLSWNQLGDIVGYSIMLATLGAIDSLLTSLVADNITRTQHNPERELIGQGIGNLVSGLFGGLPGAGATMRTVINVQAGGRTPLSGIFHSVVLLAIVLWAGKLTENIPHAVLAGILIKVGIDIIDWSFLWRVCQVSRRATVITYGVLLLTVFVDLITAVAVGAFVANILTIQRLTDLQIEKVRAIAAPNEDASISLTEGEKNLLERARGQVLLVQMSGHLSYGAAKTISYHTSREYNVLILDLTDLSFIGVTASLAIESMLKDALRGSQSRDVFIVGAKGQVKDRLQRFRILNMLPASNLLPERYHALQLALTLIQCEDRKIVR